MSADPASSGFVAADLALPEIAEADAVGAVAELYAAIRADTGSALVNYVWRHLATIDGAAPWLWSVTRSNDPAPIAAAVAEVADEAAARAARRLRPAGGFPLSEGARDVLAVYNANNVGNLARTMLLLRALDHPGAATATSATALPTLSEAPAGKALPPLPRFSDLSAPDLDALRALSAAGPAADSGVAPSLWRHLALEPGLLGRLRDPVGAALAAPAFAAAYADLRARGFAQAARAALVLPGPRPDFDRAAATLALSRFSRRIAEMTLVGRIIVEWSRPTSPNPENQEQAP